MSNELTTLLTLAGGTGVGAVATLILQRVKMGSFKALANEIMQRAVSDAESFKQEKDLLMKQRELEHQRELDKTWQIERKKMLTEEERLQRREDKLESRMTLIEKKISDVEERESLINTRKVEIEQDKKTLKERQQKLVAELEKVAGLNSDQAKERLLQRVALEVKTDTANLIKRLRDDAQEQASKTATTFIATAINRLASSCASEHTVCTILLPNEEMKGRIIGREGRNIRALENATGVNFLMDDTPGSVVISGFDPIRRHIAKLTLTELVLDGRVHPSRIEEVVQKVTSNVQKQIKEYGEDAAVRVGAPDLHPEIMVLLGKLKFRTSYGQNVLDHSLEVAHLLGMMAAELGLDIRLAKRIGLLHDIGKAVSHDVEGSHALVGRDISIKYGESAQVANGIGCHHNEIDPLTVEASLCGAADTLSASRPGARTEAVEEYIKRLHKLEEIARDLPGVDKAYALQAGREVRIVVLPDMIDDPGMVNMARDLSKKIKDKLIYPGRIKVTIIREKRVVDYAV